MSRVGDLLEAGRVMKGLTVDDVAKGSELAAGLILDIEEGRRPPTADQCQVFAALYDLDIDVLIKEAQNFHAAFWSGQGQRREVETKIGHVIPAESEMAILRDEVVRLREEMQAGVTRMKGLFECINGPAPGTPRNLDVEMRAAEAWVAQAEASLVRAQKIVG